MKNLIKQLKELSSLEPDQFKSRSFKRAAITLSSLSDDEFNNRDSFLDLSGIGKSINSIILDYKKSGVIKRLISMRNHQVAYLDPDLYKVRKSYVSKKITFDEATELLEEISGIISMKPQVAGSYRRHKSMIGDLDILVYQTDYHRIVDILSEKYELLVSGDEKTSFKLNNVDATQLDIVCVNEKDAPFKLLYLTGSKDFNIMMRGIAKKKGYTLNQLGLWDGKYRILNLDTEESIFDFLGMKYTIPEDR